MSYTAGKRKKEGEIVFTPRETAETGMKYYSDDYYSDGTGRDYAAEYLMRNNPSGDKLAGIPESEWGNATRKYTNDLIDEFNKQYPGAVRSGSSGSSGSSTFADRLNNTALQYFNMNYDDWKNGDSYEALASRYKQNAKTAMDDTVGKVSARTGGLASSYAQTAGQQVYDDYMKALEEAALNQYNSERNNMRSDLNLLAELENRDYNRRLEADKLNYERQRDALSDKRYQDELDYSRAQDEYTKNWNEEAREYSRNNSGSDSDSVTQYFDVNGKTLTYDQLFNLASESAKYGDTSLLNYLTGGNAASKQFSTVAQKAAEYGTLAEAKKYLEKQVDDKVISEEEAYKIYTENLGGTFEDEASDLPIPQILSESQFNALKRGDNVNLSETTYRQAKYVVPYCDTYADYVEQMKKASRS